MGKGDPRRAVDCGVLPTNYKGAQPPGNSPMLLETIILIVALLMLAKARRRRYRRYIRGVVDESLILTTLGGTTVTSVIFDETVSDRCFISSIDATYSLSNWTAIADVGPIVVGVAHSDYTPAEIESWIESTGLWKEADQIGQEIGKRKIRLVGTFETPQGPEDSVVLNDGKKIHTKLKWILNVGQTLQVWAYNRGSAAVATTTPDLHVEGVAHLWPT